MKNNHFVLGWSWHNVYVLNENNEMICEPNERMCEAKERNKRQKYVLIYWDSFGVVVGVVSS